MNQRFGQLLLYYVVLITIAGSLVEVDASAIRTCQLAGASALACELRLQQPHSVDSAKSLLIQPWWNDSDALSAYRRRAVAPRSSTVNVGVKDTVPKPQVWSLCAHCALEVIESDNDALGRDGDRGQLRAVLFDPRSTLKKTLAKPPTLSSSKWKGFFHTQPEGAIARFAPSGETFADAILHRGNSSVSGSTVPDRNRHPHQNHERCGRLITRPVFVFSILTCQVGHLLVDVLEPLHATMVQHYGRIPTELSPVLVFEVANEEEQHVLLEKLTSTVWEHDTPFSLLKLFLGPGGAVHTTNALRELLRADAAGISATSSSVDGSNGDIGDDGLTCFTDLHLGLDISKSYYAHGFDRHGSQVGAKGSSIATSSAPYSMSMRRQSSSFKIRNAVKTQANLDKVGPGIDPDEADPEEEEMRQRYGAFRAWLWLQLGWGAPEAKHAATVPEAKTHTVVSVVRRISSRALLNHDEVFALLQKHFNSRSDTSGNKGIGRGSLPPTAIVHELVLENLTFTEQAAVLRETDVLVCQYGSAAHNVLFMKPGSVLILLMQPHWCQWAWAFAAQATLLGIHVWIYCDESEEQTFPSLSQDPSSSDLRQKAYREPFRVRWHEHSWLQGPWFSKDESFAVDLAALQQILEHLSTHHTPTGAIAAAIDDASMPAASMESAAAAVTKGRVQHMVTAATKATRSCSQRHHLAFAADTAAASDNAAATAGALLAAQESTLDAFAAFADDYGPVSWDKSVVNNGEPLTTETRRRNEASSEDFGWRVHIGNVTVDVVAPEQGDGRGARLKVKLVPEIVFDFESSTSASSAKIPLDSLQNHPELVLCSEVIDPSSSTNDSDGGASASCHAASTFAEFSTLDLHMHHAVSLDARGQVVYGNPVVLHAWLAQSPSSEQYNMDANDSRAPKRSLPGSDTYFPVSTGQPPGQLQHRSEDFACGTSPLQVKVTLPGDLPSAPHTLDARLWAPTELQRAGAAACTAWKLQPKECAALVIALAERAAPFASADSLGLPPPQHKPTPTEPFVFLHHEKCAGTSLRRILARSALQTVGPNSFHIPCFDPINASGPIINLPPGTHRASCMSFDLAPVPGVYRNQLAVLAGHFAWGVWHQRLPNRRLSVDGSSEREQLPVHSRPNPLPVAAVPRVFLMLREPVSRVVSLYYERLEPQTQVPLNALPEDELAFYLKKFRGSAYSRWRDEGFQNAACKMLCGLHAHKGKEPSEVDAAAAAAQVNTILAVVRLQLCVVGLTHRWEDTKRVIAFWFPWVDFAAAGDVQENTSRSSSAVETRATLKPAHLTRIISANECDLALYAAAEERFDKQLQTLSTTWE